VPRGIIIDNHGCDPQTWNNHGSIAERDGDWFVFYHRSTHGCTSMRKTCVERIALADDGSISEVPMTSSGCGSPLDATVRLEASRACLLSGQARVSATADGVEDLTGIRNGDAACYRWVDFARGCASFTACVAGGGHGGSIEIRLGSADGTLLGSLPIPVRWPGDWSVHSCHVQAACGVHALWLVFRGEAGDLFDLRWICFTARSKQ
jgi:hypothetical protein